MSNTRKRLLSLFLALVMLLSLITLPAAAAAPTMPTSMAEIVEIMEMEIDGEQAFDYLSHVYLGWRTTGGPWQNYVIKDYIGGTLVANGYEKADTDLTAANDKGGKHDFFYVQKDVSTAAVWAPEYARLEIEAITGPNGVPVDATNAKAIFDVESYSFDPTSEVYQAHYKDAYSLGATVGATNDFITDMGEWIIEKNTAGERVNVFPAGQQPGAARGNEAHLNKRAHLVTNTGFNATAAEIAAVRANPADAGNLLKGKTGEVVYIADAKTHPTDAASLAALEGKVILTDSSNSIGFALAEKAGAIAVITTAALDKNGVNNPKVNNNWYGGTGYDGTNELTKWYADSARFAGGAGAAKNKAAMDAGKPIVEWNLSLQQKAAIKDAMALGTVTVNVSSLGSIYPMNVAPAEGQLTAIAEIYGSKYPDERVVIAAHVQEPGSNDNATGVALNMELALKMKTMIDTDVLPRPERTITFVWGDEMRFSDLYLDAHKEQQAKMVGSIDLDMVGEDPVKTGGPMRIEKAPDPSAYYNYTLDNLPGEDRYYDSTFADADGKFVRLPDSHTLWGAGNPAAYDLGGVYMNDLYMSAATTVGALRETQRAAGTNTAWPAFEVEVCPYEGGSDHTKFLLRKVPTILTWHFTDYTYHTTVDTLYMSSAYEMEDVGITSLAAGYHLANPTEDLTKEVITTLTAAAVDRFAGERTNSENHMTYINANAGTIDKNKALADELEVLNAWGKWYRESVQTVPHYYKNLPGVAKAVVNATTKINEQLQYTLRHANNVFHGGVDMGIPALSLDKTSISLAAGGEKVTATLSVDITAGTQGWDNAKWAAWAKTLTWKLTREGSEQDPALYPNVYTGDELKNWRTWDDKSDYFTVTEAKVLPAPAGSTAAVNTKVIELSFTNKPFFGTLHTSGYRNVFGSFIGGYDLSVADLSGVLASTALYVNIYDTYVRLDQERERVEEIQQYIKDNNIDDRYVEIVDYGMSEAGYPLYYVIFADSAASVDAFEAMNAEALKDPTALQAKISGGKLGGVDYRVPFFMNNVHADETPGRAAQINLLDEMVKNDTIKYNTITGLKPGVTKIDAFAPNVMAIEGFQGLGSPKYTVNADGKTLHNTGVNDASELYTISDEITYSVDDVLDNMIFLICPSENPDGSTYNSRRNGNGFDLNRDASNQTQAETSALWPEMSKWNPVVLTELHGFMTQFLVEPCTPPHEPNLEYDLLVENFMIGAEAYGNAAMGTMSKRNYDTKFWSYYTPLRDDYDPKTTTWSAWDDLATNYGPSYLMLNSGTMGYTIETPYNNEASTKLFETGSYGLIEYVMDNKDSIYKNQLEFFKRGIENIDAQSKMDEWYVDINNNQLAEGTWRKVGANGNYFPEYWMIPVDASNQSDPADAHEMASFLMRNGVKVDKLTQDVTVGNVTYKAGDYTINMYQAKRNYANAVLWQGADASDSGFPDLYSESVSNFPAMRGFDCVRIDTVDAFKGKTTEVTTVVPTSQFTGTTGKAVVISNNGTDAIKAVNTLLADGKTVGMITAGTHKGSFVVSYTDYMGVASKFALVGTGVEKTPVAYPIAEPTLFLTGRYDPASGYQLTTGYFSKWFATGYGFVDYRNVHSNNNSAQDMYTFGEKELNFKLTTDPKQATIVIGATPLNQGEKGAAAVAAVQAGTPYISMGSGPLNYIKANLLKDEFDFVGLGMESLHYVTYPTDSIITANYVAQGDYIAYSVNCAAITKVPAGAQVLIQGAETKSHIAGCCLTEDGKSLDGRVEAIAIKKGNVDMTIFGNSINNRVHQKDDYNYATNAIYSKMMGTTRMEIAGVENEPESSGGGVIGGGGTVTTPKDTVTVKNPDGSTTVTVTDKKTGTASATTTYADGTKVEVVTTATGSVTCNVTLPAGKTSAIVTLPLTTKPGANTVVKVINADGTQTILPWAAGVEGGMKVRVTGSGKLVLVDAGKNFTDMLSSHWAASAIQFVTSRELFLGTGKDVFSPDATMSRGMLITVLHRLGGKPTSDKVAFGDVADGAWYADAASWAASKSIDLGTNGSFNPNAEITREGLAVMLYSFAKAFGIDVSTAGMAIKEFPDADKVGAGAKDAMSWAIANGIIGGKETGKLDPAATATRSEVSAMLMRFLTNI